jgi:hypothetical protein
VIAVRRLWLTVDRLAVVEDGDDRAAFLLCGVGGKIPAEYQAMVKPVADPPAEPEPEAEKPMARRPTSKPTKPTAARK